VSEVFFILDERISFSMDLEEPCTVHIDIGLETVGLRIGARAYLWDRKTGKRLAPPEDSENENGARSVHGASSP
jgi:hypothetical protein